MILSILVAVLLNCLVPFKVYSGAIELKKIEAWQQKYTIILVKPDGKAFCGGGIVGDKIYTAAHCCAFMVWAGGAKGFGYSFNGVDTKPITSYELDGRGQDICRITPTFHERSPIKPGRVLHFDESTDEHDPLMWVINKISYIYNDPNLKFMEVQKVYRISVLDEDTEYLVIQGEAIPGTSGSLILNRRGEYIGNLSIGLPTGDRGTVPHVFGAAMLELTGWYAITP